MAKRDKNPQNPTSSPACTKGGLQQELQEKQRRIMWSVAGFDPSGGAGITADLLTFAAHGLFGCSAITALTVQSTVGVFGTEPVSSDVLRETLERLDEDLPPAGIKVGMLGTAEATHVVAQFLRARRGAKPVVVLDPVLRSSSGGELYPDAGLGVLRGELLPFVDWITPNWAELAVLAGCEVRSAAEAVSAMERLAGSFPGLHVVATGGDQEQPEDLVRLLDGQVVRCRGERVDTTSTHGTGCAFSSALLSELVLGASPVDAVRCAKRFVEGALRHAPGLGRGRGPMGLLWPLHHHAVAAE